MTVEQRKIIKELSISYNKEDRDVEYNIKFAKDVVDKFPFSYFSILRGKRFAKFWQCVVDNTIFLNDVYAKNDITRLYYFINRIDKQICCSTCGKPMTGKITSTTKWPINFHCSNRCAQKDPNVITKMRATKEKNGTTTKDLLERTKLRNRERYGVDWYYQSKQFRKKKEATWQRNGYTHPMKSKKVVDGMATRYREKYGVDFAFQNRDVQAKMKKKYFYNRMYFDSAPEIAYFIWLVDNNINFEYKPQETFYYKCNNKTHFYMPDFKVKDQFVELKGDQFFDKSGKMINPFDESQNDRYEAKHQCMLANNVKILRTNDYMQFMKYVEDKYGKDYLKQFKNSDCEEDISIPFVDSRLQKEFIYYKNLDQKSFPKAQANSHNYIVKCFQQKEFYKEEIKLWRDHDIRMRLIENRCHYLNRTIDELNTEEILRGFKIAGIHIGYSHFNPAVINWFVKEYNCRCLYDPCGGWGHRLLGSLKLDKYIYNDFSLHTKLNVDRMVEYFSLKHVETHNIDARLFVPNDDFDAMFTCPPYFNIEKYECGGFKDESEFKAFIDRLFEVFESKKSCKTFGLVIRNDMLYGHDNWTKKLVIGRDADQTHLRKARTFQEALFIFQK